MENKLDRFQKILAYFVQETLQAEAFENSITSQHLAQILTNLQTQHYLIIQNEVQKALISQLIAHLPPQASPQQPKAKVPREQRQEQTLRRTTAVIHL